MTQEEFAKKVTEAEAHVRALDAVDGHKDRDLRTILYALQAGIINPSSGAEFDAYVMLKELVDQTLPR
jgi:hypothetical protein